MGVVSVGSMFLPAFARSIFLLDEGFNVKRKISFRCGDFS